MDATRYDPDCESTSFANMRQEQLIERAIDKAGTGRALAHSLGRGMALRAAQPAAKVAPG